MRLRRSTKEYKIYRMTPLGRVLYHTGCMRMYHDGDGVGWVWRWYHPLVWVFAPLAFILSVVNAGYPITWKDRHELGFGMNPYFVEHPEELIWF